MSAPLGLKNNKVKTYSNKYSSTFSNLKHARNQSLQCQRPEKNLEENSMKINVTTKRTVSAVNLNANTRTDVTTPIRIPQAFRTRTDIKPQIKMETPAQINKKNVSVTICKRSLKGTTSPTKKSVSKNSAKKQRTAHTGVPIPEKMRKAFALMQKELNLEL